MKEIALSRGLVALVDDEAFEALSEHRWTAGRPSHANTFYAYRNVRTEDGRRRRLYMHRAVLNPSPGLMVDHINGDGLDNRRANLRVATHSENGRNRKNTRRERLKWGFRGVKQLRASTRFFAQFRGEYLGSFDTPEEAARAFDRRALEVDGEFAALNFPH